MKKIFLVLFAAVILAPLMSCNKDDGILGGSNSSSIVGKWKLMEQEQSGYTFAPYNDTVFEFDSKKTCVISVNNVRSYCTYSVSGNQLTIQEQNVLGVTITNRFVIRSKTKNELVLEVSNYLQVWYLKRI